MFVNIVQVTLFLLIYMQRITIFLSIKSHSLASFTAFKPSSKAQNFTLLHPVLLQNKSSKQYFFGCYECQGLLSYLEKK